MEPDLSLRILVVDDMPAMRSIVRNMLEELGFKRVAEAEDGEMAWQLIQQAAISPQKAFGMVISDWNMPGLSGVELLRAIRSSSHSREMPFFMVTAEGDRDHLAEAASAGVTDYVVKPFNAAQLAEKIGAAFTY